MSEAAPAATEAAAVEAPSQQETPNQPAPEAQEAAPRKLPSPVKLKFKGKEETVDDLDQLAKWAQMGRGATEVFEQAKKLREEAEAKASRLEKLKGGSLEDRLALLTETLGDEEAALAFMEEALYQKRIAPQQLTPEQRQMQQLQRELQAFKEKEAQQTKAAREAELEKQADAIAQQYAKTAADVMAKLGWGPELAPLVLREMLPYAEQALEAGLDPVSEDIIGMFMQDQQAKVSNFAKQLKGEQLLRFLGDDVANEIRKADLARLRGGTSPKAQPAAPKADAKPTSDDPLEAAREAQRKRRSFWSEDPYK